MYNNIVTVGRAGKDSEKKQTSSGKLICEFNLAIDDNKKINGEWVNNTIWFKVSCFGLQAEKLEVKKGELVLVDGKLTEQKYINNDGVEVSRINIIADTVKKLIKEEKTQNQTSSKKVKEDDDLPF